MWFDRFIGTFHHRKIEDTLIGFKKFYDKYNDRINMSYTLIGKGKKRDDEKIVIILDEYHMHQIVNIKKPVPFKDLTGYLDTHNIGVSYIPITNFYDIQPPTKTYDYLFSGLVVIGTDTKENRKIICKENGVLIDDNYDAFFKGLEELFINRCFYDINKIRLNFENYSWCNIVNDILKPLIKRIYNLTI